MIRITIGGDLCPINSNELAFSLPDNQILFNGIEEYFKESDLNIANLEGPITTSNFLSAKPGSRIKILPHCINGIKNSGFNILVGANNHIGDYGEKGIIDTIEVCKSHDISLLGVGLNVNEAKLPIIYEKQGKKVGIVAFADTEFGMASVFNPGANPFNLIDAIQSVEELKAAVDYIIVLLHEGKEYSSYPSPELQKNCRFLISKGVDLIVCQHSHVIGAWEKYLDGNIFYGQGNLIFDYAGRRTKEWIMGCIINIVLGHRSNEIELIPYKQVFPGIMKLSLEDRRWFDGYIEELSKNVKDDDFVRNNWDTFCAKYLNDYLNIFKGNNRLVRRLLKISGLYKKMYTPQALLILLNISRSRVHRETVITVLKKFLEEKGVDI